MLTVLCAMDFSHSLIFNLPFSQGPKSPMFYHILSYLKVSKWGSFKLFHLNSSQLFALTSLSDKIDLKFQFILPGDILKKEILIYFCHIKNSQGPQVWLSDKALVFPQNYRTEQNGNNKTSFLHGFYITVSWFYLLIVLFLP